MAKLTRTEGQRQLEAWLAADKSRTRDKLGKALGISGQAVSMWLSREKPTVPAETLWSTLKALTGIDGELFLSESRRKKRAEQMRAREEAVAALERTGT